jgi:hypothetical protein
MTAFAYVGALQAIAAARPARDAGDRLAASAAT